MPSWPSLFVIAIAMWLLLRGPAAKMPPFVRKGCRTAMVFFAYCGFLYLLKWDPFWEWMLSLRLENRNQAEGFLILASTLVWLIATLRILFWRQRLPALAVGSGVISNRVPRQEKTRSSFRLKNIAIFHYFFTRK